MDMRRIILLALCVTVLLWTASSQTPTAQNATTTQASTAPAPAKAKKTIDQELNSGGSILGDPPIVTPPPSKEQMKPAEVPAWLTELVVKQFGKEFEIFPKDHQVLFTGDLDGDGVEDAVIVVRSAHPQVGATEHNYKILAPEEEYYGWGEAKTFLDAQTSRWQEQRIFLVIHGAGAQGWRSETPKAKFVMVNLPFEKIQLTTSTLKKKTRAIIEGENKTMTSIVFWTGKKYKFDPTGTVD